MQENIKESKKEIQDLRWKVEILDYMLDSEVILSCLMIVIGIFYDGRWRNIALVSLVVLVCGMVCVSSQRNKYLSKIDRLDWNKK